MKKNHYGEGSVRLKDKEGKEYLLTVEFDSYAESPRDTDITFSEIWTFGKYSYIGDNKPDCVNTFYDALTYLCDQYEIEYDYESDDEKALIEKLKWSNKVCFHLVHCYDHGGLSISLSPYYDRWDSGIIGFAFCDVMALDEKGNFIGDNYIKEEIKVLDSYVSNEVYRFTLEEKIHKRIEEKCPCCGYVCKVNEYDDYEFVDSCCNFYGLDWNKNGIAEYLYWLEEIENENCD